MVKWLVKSLLITLPFVTYSPAIFAAIWSVA